MESAAGAPLSSRRKCGAGTGLEEGALIIAEPRADGSLIRPAVALPVEVYSDERKAEFLLSNAVDSEEYA